MRGQVLLTAANFDRFAIHLNEEVAPDIVMHPCVFETPPDEPPDPFPAGPGNLGHFRANKLIRESLRRSGRPTILLQHRDPKTVSIREDFYLGYDAETRAWKAEMLRLHTSQHSRNLDTRGVGFDARLVIPECDRCVDRGLAKDGVVGVELFQCDFVNGDL